MTRLQFLLNGMDFRCFFDSKDFQNVYMTYFVDFTLKFQNHNVILHEKQYISAQIYLIEHLHENIKGETHDNKRRLIKGSEITSRTLEPTQISSGKMTTSERKQAVATPNTPLVTALSVSFSQKSRIPRKPKKRESHRSVGRVGQHK